MFGLLYLALGRAYAQQERNVSDALSRSHSHELRLGRSETLRIRTASEPIREPITKIGLEDHGAVVVNVASAARLANAIRPKVPDRASQIDTCIEQAARYARTHPETCAKARQEARHARMARRDRKADLGGGINVHLVGDVLLPNLVHRIVPSSVLFLPKVCLFPLPFHSRTDQQMYFSWLNRPQGNVLLLTRTVPCEA